MKVRHPNKYDRKAASRAAAIDFKLPSRTQQQFREEADVNTIVKRFNLTGHMPTARSLPEYGDFSTVDDFQSAMQQLRRSQESFNALPAHLRDRFENRPDKFLAFLQDEGNEDEARRIGLLPKKPPQSAQEPSPAPTPPATPPAPATAA